MNIQLPDKPHFYISTDFPIVSRSATNSPACYQKHSHEEFSIGIVENGISDFYYSGKSEKIGNGSLVIINPGDVHSCNPEKGSKWSYKMMYIDTSWLRALQSDIINTFPYELSPLGVHHLTRPDIYRRFKALFSLLTNTTENRLLLDQELFGFFGDIFSLGRSIETPSEKTANLALHRARDFIADQCDKNITIDEIASVAGLSSFYLIRQFRKIFGITPHAYQISIRINKAKYLLRSGMDISTVAIRLGFTDQSHFHRNFKRMVAATPKQYKDSFLK